MMWSQHHKILTLLLGFATALGQIASDSSAVRKIGPIINDLPVLDSLIAADDSTAKKKVSHKQTTPLPETYPINASGSF